MAARERERERREEGERRKKKERKWRFSRRFFNYSLAISRLRPT